MRRSTSRWILPPFLFFTSLLLAVPVPSGNSGATIDRKKFFPQDRTGPLPGKVVGVLAPNSHPLIRKVGRFLHDEDAIYLSLNGDSYRWFYAPLAANDPRTNSVTVPVVDRRARMQFERVLLLRDSSIQSIGMTADFHLVEIEVNGGHGSPEGTFVASKIRKLDGSKEYPLKVAEVVRGLQSRYSDYLTNNSREIDVGMSKAAAKVAGRKKELGLRHREDSMYVTWMMDSERLEVRFLTRITDTAELYPGARTDEAARYTTAARRAGPISTARAGYDYQPGPQFGIEFGMAYVVSKEGKLERSIALPIEPFAADQAAGRAISKIPSTKRGATFAVRPVLPVPPPPPPPPK